MKQPLPGKCDKHQSWIFLLPPGSRGMNGRCGCDVTWMLELLRLYTAICRSCSHGQLVRNWAGQRKQMRGPEDRYRCECERECECEWKEREGGRG